MSPLCHLWVDLEEARQSNTGCFSILVCELIYFNGTKFVRNRPNKHLNSISSSAQLSHWFNESASSKVCVNILILQYQDSDTSGREFGVAWSKQRIQIKGNPSRDSSQVIYFLRKHKYLRSEIYKDNCLTYRLKKKKTCII